MDELADNDAGAIGTSVIERSKGQLKLPDTVGSGGVGPAYLRIPPMLGADLLNGVRGLYKAMQIVARLGEQFAKASRSTEPAPASPTITPAATE